MQIWQKGIDGIWKRRETQDFLSLKEKSLLTFIAQRRNMQNTHRQTWIVFENHEITKLAWIGNFLISNTRQRSNNKHVIAKRTLEFVLRDLLRTRVVYVKLTPQEASRVNMEPIALKAKSYRYLAVQINPFPLDN